MNVHELIQPRYSEELLAFMEIVARKRKWELAVGESAYKTHIMQRTEQLKAVYDSVRDGQAMKGQHLMLAFSKNRLPQLEQDLKDLKHQLALVLEDTKAARSWIYSLGESCDL